MDTIFQGMDGVICYLDDILVSGKTEEHLENLKSSTHVESTWHTCQCSFLQLSVQYLGHRIAVDGLHATDSKLKAIVDVPVPKNVSELRSFLGVLN